ncbi:MAG: GH25 family lysozyme, partial [Pseudomonadota bacterium]
MSGRFVVTFAFVLSTGFASALLAVDPPATQSQDISRLDRKHLATTYHGLPDAPLPQRFRFPDDAQGTSFGIDVSHHNGKIDWAQTKGIEIGYVYIKASQGTTNTDQRFAANWSGATDAGHKLGAYHFLSSLSPAEDQAAHFLSVYSDRSDSDLPPVLDVEWDLSAPAADGHRSDRWASQSSDQIAASIKSWVEAVAQATGKTPLIYTNTDWWNQRVGSAGTDLGKTYPMWIASYSTDSATAPAVPP